MIGPNGMNAFCRSSGWKDCFTIASPCGIITAPNSALQHPERDQHAGGRRQPAQQRGDGEAGHADEEHPAPADEVAEPGPR